MTNTPTRNELLRRLRVAAAAMEHQRQVRDALITELHARDDVTTRAIGDAARIHHTHVLNIARKAVG